MKRSHDSMEAARTSPEAVVEWPLSNSTRIALFVPTTERGAEVLCWPRTVYYMPGTGALVEGLTFTLYALVQTTLPADILSRHLQSSYLATHIKNPSADADAESARLELKTFKERFPHRFWLSMVLEARKERGHDKPQAFIQVKNCDADAFHYKHAVFESKEFTGVDPVTGARVSDIGKAVRKVCITTTSHHVFAHIINARGHVDEITIARNSDHQTSHAFLLLYKSARDGMMYMARAPATHALIILREQLPVTIDDFKPLCDREKADAQASSARKIAYDGNGDLLTKPLVQKRLVFSAASHVVFQCDRADVKHAEGLLVSGAFEVIGIRELAQPMDVDHFLGTKGRFLEAVAMPGPPLCRVQYERTRIMRSLGVGSNGGGSGSASRNSTTIRDSLATTREIKKPVAKSTDELVAEDLRKRPPRPPPVPLPPPAMRAGGPGVVLTIDANLLSAFDDIDDGLA